MAQIVPGTNWAEQLGTGLGAGLQQLAGLKLQQLQQRHGLAALGYTPEQADQLSNLSPQILNQVVKQKLQEPSQLAFGQALQQLLGGEQQQFPLSELENISMAQQQQAIPQQQAPQMPGLANLIPQLAQKPQIQAQSQVNVPSQPRPLTPAQVEQLQKRQQAGLAIPPRLNERQASELAKLGLKKQALEKGEIKERFKMSQAERKEIAQGAKAARQDLKDLERLEELEKEGKLDTPGYVEFLKRSGLDIPALMEPGSEEFAKLTANFQKNAKQYFGSRISNYELEQFLKTIPSLSQSPEGRKRVIANLKYMGRAALEYNNTLKEVLAENNGVPPYDLQEQIDDKIEKKLDVLGKRFKEDLNRPVPKGQNKYITGLQATLGTAAGNIGRAATGAGLGALAGGRYAGVPGAIAGGALGGLAGLGGLSVKDLL